MAVLSGTLIGVIAANGFDRRECEEPLEFLRILGADVEIFSPGEAQSYGKIRSTAASGEKPLVLNVNWVIDEKFPIDRYRGFFLPGGEESAGRLLRDPGSIGFIRRLAESDKPMAALGAGAGLLLASGRAEGRTITGPESLAPMAKTSHAHLIADQTVWVDGPWVTGRGRMAISDFNREMVELFANPAPMIPGKTRNMVWKTRFI